MYRANCILIFSCWFVVLGFWWVWFFFFGGGFACLFAFVCLVFFPRIRRKWDLYVGINKYFFFYMEEVSTPSTFCLNFSFVNRIKNYFNWALQVVPRLGFPLSETALGTCPVDGCTQRDTALSDSKLLVSLCQQTGYLTTIHSLGCTLRLFPVSEAVSVLLPSCW